MCRRRVGILEGCFAPVLTRFSEERQVDFDDGTIEAKDSLEVGFDNIASQVGDDDHLCVRFFIDRTFVINIHLRISDMTRRR